ncbi:MAG: WecB/TagA/CpsF family glycosyltransferase [Vulcanimicrobiaceae bacterium]
MSGGGRQPRVSIAEVAIDPLRFREVVDEIAAYAQAPGEPAFVVTPNAHHVVTYQRDAALREAYRAAHLVVADGVPLLWAARVLGQRLPERVNGTDLFEALCARAAERGLRVFLLGGRPGAAEAAARVLCARHPSLVVCGSYCPPLGFEASETENERICAAITTARPHLLFVGLGVPKQELWMLRHRTRLGVPVSLGIGVSFELVGGVVARAPRWMQRCGLEWLFRALAEPRRLWRRYLFGNAAFCLLVARQRLGLGAPVPGRGNRPRTPQ